MLIRPVSVELFCSDTFFAVVEELDVEELLGTHDAGRLKARDFVGPRLGL